MRDCINCEYFDEEDEICTAFVCDGLDCSPLPCELEEQEKSKKQ